jgi:hypothetical protein
VWLIASSAGLLLGGLAALSGNDLLFSPLSLMLIAGWLVTFAAAIVWRCGAVVVALALVLPIALLAAMLVDGPATVRAVASQEQLAEAYVEVRAGREVDHVGFYRVTESWIDDSGCAVFVTHTLLLVDDSGVAYCPDGLTPTSSTLEPLFGPLHSYSIVR